MRQLSRESRYWDSMRSARSRASRGWATRARGRRSRRTRHRSTTPTCGWRRSTAGQASDPDDPKRAAALRALTADRNRTDPRRRDPALGRLHRTEDLDLLEATKDPDPNVVVFATEGIDETKAFTAPSSR